MAEKYRDRGLVVLAPNAWDEDRATVRDFVKSQKLTHRMLMNGSRLQSQYQLNAVPTLIWIDRSGIIQDLEIGYAGPEPIEQKTKRLVEGK